MMHLLAQNMPSSQSIHSTTSSSSTKVRLPVEEANKAAFPPGVKVLCFDNNGVQVGIVKNVLVSISVQSERTFGTFYEVETKGDNGQAHNLYVANDLRLTPGSQVIVDRSYFGNVFGGANGNARGTILGSFESPPAYCVKCSRKEAVGNDRSFFYSVRVKFNGMEEAVEAHGVPPENIHAVPPCNIPSDSSTILTDGLESFRFGDVPYSTRDEYKENHYDMANTSSRRMSQSRTPIRIKPEDSPPFEQPMGVDEEPYQHINSMYYDQFHTKSFHKPLENTHRQIFESETISTSFESPKEIVRESPMRGRSRTNVDSPATRRSLSRPRTYVIDHAAHSMRNPRDSALPSSSPANMAITVNSSVSDDSEFQSRKSRHNNIVEINNQAEVDDVSYEEEAKSYSSEEEEVVIQTYSAPKASQEKHFSHVAGTQEPPPASISTQEGCYLLFDENSGGKMTIQYSKSSVNGAIGFWAPSRGKKLQGFKFTQNQGRTDLLKDIAGKDYKKKYFSGVCQFVKAARMQTGIYCKWSDHERIENDIYVFYNDTCEIKQIIDGELFDVGDIDAVAVVPKGNTTFIGVKTGEYGAFLGRGDAAGASLAIFN